MDVSFEGCIVEVADDTVEAEMTSQSLLRPGAMYLAKRNTGWKLLTCRLVDTQRHFVVPMEVAYCFDTWECYRVLTIR